MWPRNLQGNNDIMTNDSMTQWTNDSMTNDFNDAGNFLSLEIV